MGMGMTKTPRPLAGGFSISRSVVTFVDSDSVRDKKRQTKKGSRGVMDSTSDYGSLSVGSNPAGSTRERTGVN